MERRSIDELVVRYELEPSLKDAYVEGATDRALVEWIAREAGLDGVVAYEISTVDIPSPLTTLHETSNGNRGRVIALAYELLDKTDFDLFRSVVCVADADFAYARGDLDVNPLLVFSDFTAAELYLFDEQVLEKYLQLVLGRDRSEAAQVLSSITPILHELFLVRLIAFELAIDLAPIAFDRCCTIRDRKFTFDAPEYVKRFLNRGEASRFAEFWRELEQWRERIQGDPRSYIHGHDFIDVLHWYLTKVMRVGKVSDREDFARTIWAALEFRNLAHSSLVAELKRRFGSS